MKVVTIQGSPRANGNTAAVLEKFEKALGDGHEIERVDLQGLNIGGCLACYACTQNLTEPGCVQMDDAQGVLDQILGADAVVYATPLYMWTFPAQIKALLDRHLCFVKGYTTPDYTSLIKDKRVALLVTCGGPVEGNADLIQESFNRLAKYGFLDHVGNYVVPGCTTPVQLGEAADAVVSQMTADIAGS